MTEVQGVDSLQVSLIDGAYSILRLYFRREGVAVSLRTIYPSVEQIWFFHLLNVVEKKIEP